VDPDNLEKVSRQRTDQWCWDGRRVHLGGAVCEALLCLILRGEDVYQGRTLHTKTKGLSSSNNSTP
jgi:hypothetical protein